MKLYPVLDSLHSFDDFIKITFEDVHLDADMYRNSPASLLNTTAVIILTNRTAEGNICLFTPRHNLC